ncbi:MAG TPA: carboxymuconolactone decarboxylase family protein [Terriglobales bacterium]|nr:carboxymuconolactone decarboxylase family protein [Terriglobales bacterium]
MKRLPCLAAMILLPMLGAAPAQDRMPPIPSEKMTELQKKAAQEVISGPRGRLAGPYPALLRSPELMSRLQKAGEYLRFNSPLPADVREMTILVVAREWTQQTEWDSHYELALKAGVKPETVASISQGRRPVGMSGDEELAYDFLDELQRSRSVSDETYARALQKFGEQGVIDLTVLHGYYTSIAMVMNMARTALLPEHKPLLMKLPN